MSEEFPFNGPVESYQTIANRYTRLRTGVDYTQSEAWKTFAKSPRAAEALQHARDLLKADSYLGQESGPDAYTEPMYKVLLEAFGMQRESNPRYPTYGSVFHALTGSFLALRDNALRCSGEQWDALSAAMQKSPIYDLLQVQAALFQTAVQELEASQGVPVQHRL